MDNFSLHPQIPAQGWQQFLTSRQDMLDEYDKARIKSKTQKVETLHGKVAEAEFRKWLQNFLPRKFGVTSGYIISQGIPSSEKTPHFDVIIYDQLEAPILWIENNPDNSEQGKSRAIPAEYVNAVIEVKSAFKAATVRQALGHLNDLKVLMSGVDLPTDRYKLYLPSKFICFAVFFELRIEDENDFSALGHLLQGIDLRGFHGGVIMRGEYHSLPFTGLVQIMRSNNEVEASMLSKFGDSLLSTKLGAVSDSRIKNNHHYIARLQWGEENFATFSFNLLAMLNGNYDGQRMASFHVHGWTPNWDDHASRNSNDRPSPNK